MNNHVFVLVLFYPYDTSNRTKPNPRIEAVYTQRRDAESRKNAINSNNQATSTIEVHKVEQRPGAPSAAVLKLPLYGEDSSGIKSLKKIHKLSDDLNTALYDLRRSLKNKRVSKKRRLFDDLLGY